MSLQQRVQPRQAHTPGTTVLSYTPDGKKLITAGASNPIRVFTSGSDAEPINIDDCMPDNTCVVASNTFFIAGSEDGTVCKYSLETNSLETILVRSTLAVRDVALSPDANWVAVASDELVVKVVNTKDMTRVFRLQEQPKAVKHVAFDNSGTYLAVSCTDGQIYVYSMSSDEPQLIKKVDDMIRSMGSASEASSKVLWHPDGRAFATPTTTREIQVMSRLDWHRQKTFKTDHIGDITAAAWSPNGAFLVTTATDRKLYLWDSKTLKVIKTYDDIRETVLAVAWHPTENTISYTNGEGQLFIRPGFVPEEHAALLRQGLQPAPFLHDPLAENGANGVRRIVNGPEKLAMRGARAGTPDSLDDMLDGMSDAEDEGFVVDDDGAGYADEVINGHGKRTNGHLDAYNGASKRRVPASHSFEPEVRPSFQPGSTPWQGNRRYLCLNLTGFAWTVSQETHHTVTVEFYDREAHRDFHFTDPYLYDKACLNDNGALFSSQPNGASPAMIFYRPHETWTTRTEWRTELPAGEEVSAIALSESYAVVTTSSNYVRIFTLFGVPIRVYRQKSSPTVTCAAWRDYVMTIGNGPVGGDGICRLLYTIENIKRDETCQSEDVVALAPGASLQSVFFSDNGDPYIYDSTGVLLTLLHWRTPSQARWTPLLDTRQLSRLAAGTKTESYWPVAVAGNKFYCVILKGADKHPYFPRSILTDFEFQIPLSGPRPSKKGKSAEDTEMDDDTKEAANKQLEIEERFVRNSVLLAQQADTFSVTRTTSDQRHALALRESDVNKALLQLLQLECLAGEERGMKALEIVGLLKDPNGNMLTAAEKLARKYQRDVLAEKIRELAERRLVGLDADEEMD
ncbi:WD40 repeat-like protein [Mytilinidion resinicola]|uniref:WD40 repeat-like protein n=1 Tax=Mytilinidion resinicola TaxID=574789 RepID=A0A6A6YSF7_9PEZI|nr:WD40 repeat-like protein [Mytilinidion resinicola]KAF2811862.1 WD40 repeat-like protein [Mytilinidion resinicola]